MRLYHNPRCSKSRQALALLKERKIIFEEYRYLDRGIAEEDFDILLNLEGIIRIKDIDSDKNIDLSKRDDVKKLLKENPKLLERPILIDEDNAVIGRPPENILTLLD